MKTTCEIVFWRDIPAQVRARAGRERVSKELPERFQQAIDAAAMHSGKRGTDAYLAEWVSRPAAESDAPPERVAESLAAEIEKAYGADRLSRLARSGGVEG